ncbi:MAG: DUF2794 domain-containing protein [Alphaproteobacteria bacterium]|nr:DUF2794 domain-containing protein [Alphaproteobacteria bacterium]
MFGASLSLSSSRKSQGQSFNQKNANWSGAKTAAPVPKTTFNRQELNSILTVYGRQVGAGEWRDYAIYHGSDRAVFSIFRRSSEMPLYTVEKQPDLARRQGIYSVIAAGGRIMRRGQDLKQVLRIIDRKPSLVAV